MTTPLMTNIDINLYDFITYLSQKEHKNKRVVLEEIISYYKNIYEQKELEATYSIMQNDTEYLEEMVKNTHLLGSL